MKMEKNAEKQLLKIIEEDPGSVMMFMMVQMGKMVVETNAGQAELKQESTFDRQRYEIKAKITVKKIKNKTPQP